MRSEFQTLIEEIQKQQMVTMEIRKKYFPSFSFKQIRDWLEKHGIDRTLTIETISTEIAIVTPVGILLQIRADDNNQLGMWGGNLDIGESPDECAVRELHEETGLQIDKNQLKFIEEILKSFHEYANGNKGCSTVYRYILKLDFVPKVKLNNESNGIKIVSSKKEIEREVLDQEKSFIEQCLLMLAE